VGEQIRTQENEIGGLVTVTLQAVEDGDSTLLTLLVPRVNLGDMGEQAIKTIAILTTERWSIAGPSLVTGAVQSYHTVKLRGKAQLSVGNLSMGYAPSLKGLTGLERKFDRDWCSCTSLQVSPVHTTIALASATVYTDTLYGIKNGGQTYGRKRY
jgi:hypothetical protein